VTKSTGSRMTSAREIEIREDMARLDQRITELEGRVDTGELLAHELGQAALRALRKQPPSNKRGSNL